LPSLDFTEGIAIFIPSPNFRIFTGLRLPFLKFVTVFAVVPTPELNGNGVAIGELDMESFVCSDFEYGCILV
jgi:hypothetical protein